MKDFSIHTFVMGVILGVALASAWFVANNPALVLEPLLPSSFVVPDTETPSTLGENTAVSVIDQSSGDSVSVESVTVPPPGVWIAVRETNGKKLGNVLGAVRVNGPRTGVTVPLLRTTEPDHFYAIELYRDDHNGTFDPSANSVYVDFETGKPVIAYFRTSL